jgi:Mg-chelatase subunit ChlD
LLKNSIKCAANLLSKPIKITHDTLKSRIESMKTALLTDLPPGLISSVGLASMGPLGSQVIICTDGESKGALNSEEYYRKIGEYAKEKGVTIHIVTFTGTECNINKISIVS